MKKSLIIILLLTLIFAACRGKKSSSEDTDFGFFNPDKKDEAAKIVEEANGDLVKVKTIYKANQNKVEEITSAMKNKEVDKVKTIANDLVIQISEGIENAKTAVNKIRDAEDMEINSTYKDYLQHKRQALEKQIEAFESRQQVAKLVADSFGSKDAAKIDQAAALFTNKEQQFQKLMDEAKALSDEANEIYRDSLKQK